MQFSGAGNVMRPALIVLFVLCAFGAPTETDAAAGDWTCTGYAFCNGGALQPEGVGTIVQLMVAAHNEVLCDVQGIAENGSAYVTSGPTYLGIDSYRYSYVVNFACTRTDNGNDAFTAQGVIYADITDTCVEGEFDTATGECIVPEECPFFEGMQFIKSGDGNPPASICQSGCTLSPAPGPSIRMGGGYMQMFEITGSCSPSDSSVPPTGNNCIQTSDGTQYCADPASTENCGTVNGEYVCIDAVPEGNCIFTPTGQAICDGGSQTNPPDTTIEDGDGNDVDVYSDGNTGGTDGGTGTSSGTNDADGDGNPDGGLGSDESDECDGGACDGDAMPELEAVDGFGDLFVAFYDDVEASPLIASYSGLAESLPAGSCTTFDSDPIAFLNNTVLTIDSHCSLWAEIAPIISSFMMAVWTLLGFFIILRA